MWTGCSLLRLPYFDPVERFFQQAEICSHVELSAEIAGQVVTFPLDEQHWRPLIRGVSKRIEFISKARIVGQRLAVDPPLPDLDGVLPEQIEELLVLWEAVTCGQCRRPGAAYVLMGNLVMDTKAAERLARGDITSFRFAVRTQRPAALFGAVSAQCVLVEDFLHLRLTDESCTALSSPLAQPPIRIQLIPSDESEVITRVVASSSSTDSLPLS